MPGIARQFEPQITRSGGAPSKYRFVVRCSDCASTDAYEASKPTSNETVKSYFDERGWLLGRERSYDLCPACLARPRRDGKADDGRRRATADILARHLGKPEALAAEVFRPKDTAPPQPSPPRIAQQPKSTPSLSPEVEETLAGMAADLKGLRAAVELMADQVCKLVVLGGQQLEAVARLAPALLQSAEGLSGSLRQVANAVQLIPHPSPAGDVQPPPDPSSGVDEMRGGDPEPAAAPVAEVQSSSGQARGERTAKERTARSTAAPVVVRSIADAKRSDRYYTSIRLPRDLWDRSGFGPDDRLLLDWSGKALTIERATEGGVKPKSIGDTSVVLQSWKLGNLNLDQPKTAGADGSLRLTAGRRSPET
ncbi:hypothetical protein [Microvirga splendida]|uniref:Uncharacterized protein n=1 Tax=Microvirga splendida TaxID=2795727 RepID=A0ABS0Y3M5_9HYPH|nr:hypothetical protein [Microvirga splendida]MBJ6126892.1 hypothetical protein [Microvirga splendida]